MTVFYKTKDEAQAAADLYFLKQNEYCKNILPKEKSMGNRKCARCGNIYDSNASYIVWENGHSLCPCCNASSAYSASHFKAKQKQSEEKEEEKPVRNEGLEVKEQTGKKPTDHFGHPRFYEILENMADLHSRKNHDYAGTSDPLKNLRACERLELEPFMGVMVRLQDKWSRLEEFVKSGKLMVKSESVIDTLMDNAVYSVLAIILYEEQQKREKGGHGYCPDCEKRIKAAKNGESIPICGKCQDAKPFTHFLKKEKPDRTKPVPGGY